MTIDIQEICSRWNISRPTVMKAISERKLIGEKDRQGKWEFETSNVVMWRGEPDDLPPRTPAKSTDTTPMLLLMRTMEDYIGTLKSQLDVKDQQLADQQETNREQLRLLTYAGPALEAASSTNEEVEQLKKQLAAKEEQLEKVVHATAEQVASLMKVKAAEQPSAEETEEIVLDAEQEEIAQRIAVVQQERDEIEATEDFDHWDAGTRTSRQKKISGSDS
jgi:seryl-tRNA synthetase